MVASSYAWSNVAKTQNLLEDFKIPDFNKLTTFGSSRSKYGCVEQNIARRTNSAGNVMSGVVGRLTVAVKFTI